MPLLDVALFLPRRCRHAFSLGEELLPSPTSSTVYSHCPVRINSLVATRWSFLSSLKEESRSYHKDPLKACGCASATPYTAENNVFVELKDPKVWVLQKR